MLRCCRGRWRERSRELLTVDKLRPGIWLDATDRSTITIATGVSAWRNKGAVGGSVVQATTTKQPLYQYPYVVFDGANHDMSFLQIGSAFTLCAVFKDDESAGDTTRLAILSDSGGTEYVPIALNGDANNNSLRLDGVNYYGTDYAAHVNGVLVSPWDRNKAYDDLVTGQRKIVCIQCPRANSAASGIGAHSQYKLSGQLSMLIACTGLDTTYRRQLLEGIVAWHPQINIAHLLPAPHPFKLRPPLAGD